MLLAMCIARVAVAQTGDANAARSDDEIAQRLETTTIGLRDSSVELSVRNIDITKFPRVGIVFDVFNSDHAFVQGIRKSDILITENGVPQDVQSLSLITSQNRVPIDFVFLIDQTGSMGGHIDAVKQNIDDFTTRLAAKGIDYRLGLVVFDDRVASRHWLTDNLDEFKGWISEITAEGGGDVAENALEALRAATGMNFRSSANRCIVLITDAPFHQYGSGRTMYTARTMRAVLNRYEMRTFCITSPEDKDYNILADGTGGQVFDINRPFAEILNRFVSTMTSLYTATYQSNADVIPDSIDVEISLKGTRLRSHKKFAVLDIGRKLIVDNVLFATNQYTLKSQSFPELDYLVRLMKARPTLKVKIEGHTDNVGSDEFNMKLSYQRAEAVREYMVKHGIARERLYTLGYGSTRPTATNDTEEGRRLNRRTEFIIVQK